MSFLKKNFIEDFIVLIKECNKIVLDIYNSEFEVSMKSNNSPLTLADKQCNKHICNFLKKNFSDILIISEENKQINYNIRKKYELCWLIDPIDGTKEFIKKNGQFTINIGLCRKGIPVFGIVSIPVTGEIYYGIEGLGSFKIENNNIKKLIIKKKDFNKIGLNIVLSLSHSNETTEAFIKLFKNANIVRAGSSIKLLWIAEGKADIYPRLAPTSEWDTCAAHAIVKYSEGNIVVYEKNTKDFLNNKVIKYNKPSLLNPYFIAY